MNPKVWYKVNNGVPVWDFAMHAAIGAYEMGIPISSYENIDDIPINPFNIIVSNVEEAVLWLTAGNYEIPEQIDILQFSAFLNRNVTVASFDQIFSLKYPIFIKPYKKLKAFTGFVATDPAMLEFYSEGYKGDLLVSEVINLQSEWRFYVRGTKIINGISYRGNPLIFPEPNFVKNLFEVSKYLLPHASYTIDIGIDSNSNNYLIELQDGWAIGNYGLSPKEYYLFVRDRWLQMTGIKSKKEYVL